MPVPQENKSYIYEDYLKWPDDEIWGLIEGIPYMKAAPSLQHQAITFELGR